MKNKNHMIIAIDTEKAMDKAQHPPINKMGLNGLFLLYSRLSTTSLW